MFVYEGFVIGFWLFRVEGYEVRIFVIEEYFVVELFYGDFEMNVG